MELGRTLLNFPWRRFDVRELWSPVATPLEQSRTRPPLLLSLLLTSGSAFAPLRLAPKALKICRPVLNQYIHTPSEFTQYSTELFGLIARGELKLSRWKEEGYEFSAQGIKSAQEDISTSLFYLLQCGGLIEYSVSQDDGKIASQSGGMNGFEKKMRNFDICFSSPDRCVMVLGNTHFIPPIMYEMKAMKNGDR